MHLRNDMRQKNTQKTLDFNSTPTGEARAAGGEATESFPAMHAPENPASTNQLMEEICERENLKRALQRVKANKGSPGIDGMTVEELLGYLQQHWPAIREQLLSGNYAPKPVRRVEIAKPDGGGMRKLGIPTALDRFVQQAVLQVLQRLWDPTFSEHSYGFRPGRSAHQAVAQAQKNIAEGYSWVVDLDLEKFCVMDASRWAGRLTSRRSSSAASSFLRWLSIVFAIRAHDNVEDSWRLRSRIYV